MLIRPTVSDYPRNVAGVSGDLPSARHSSSSSNASYGTTGNLSADLPSARHSSSSSNASYRTTGNLSADLPSARHSSSSSNASYGTTGNLSADLPSARHSKTPRNAGITWLIASLCILFFALPLSAQLQFHINHFDMRELQAGNQNWDIASDGEQTIFAANNYGLIEIRNSGAILHPSPSGTIMRSVRWINGRLYTGSFEEFGYWQPDEAQGKALRYTSLADKLDHPQMNNNEIWRIVEHQGRIYFHSFGDIYVYDGEMVQRVATPGQMMFLHCTGQRVFAQLIRGGLFELVDQRFIPVPGTDFLSAEEVKSVVRLSPETLLIGTSDNLYRFRMTDGDPQTSISQTSLSATVLPEIWKVDQYDELIAARINAIAITARHIIIGTILNGLYIYTHSGRILRNISSSDLLQNNTVLSLMPDDAGNVWVGMDKGLDYISFDSPISIWRDRDASLGSVYTASMHQDDLYVGTNQGLFWFPFGNPFMLSEKQLVSGSQGQVWFLRQIDGDLYAGLNDGTYLVRNKNLERVSQIDGAYNLKPWPQRSPEAYLQSTYNELVEFRKIDGIWQQFRIIPDLYMPVRYLEFDHLGAIWLGHAVKGVWRVHPGFTENEPLHVYSPADIQGLDTPTGKVFRMGNRVIVPSGNSLLQWDAVNDVFIPFELLDPHFTEQTPVLAIHPAGMQRYWVIKRNELLLFELRYDGVELLYRILPAEFGFSLVEGYETIVPLDDQMYLICLDDGFALLDLGKVNNREPRSIVTSLDIVRVIGRDGARQIDTIADENEARYHSGLNTLHFQWTTNHRVGHRIFFQFRLAGYEEDWSSWSTQTSATYQRLNPGNYNFEVRSVTPSGLLTGSAMHMFTIRKPWYQTPVAFTLYVILLVSFVLMIRFYISRRKWRARGKLLEEEREKILIEKKLREQDIVQLTNEKLQAEVEHKTSQLAANTMSVVRKNELLNTLKEELIKQKDELGDRLPKKYIQQLTAIIDRGLDNEQEWEDFENLYDQTHGNFFKRLKEAYPQLTSSDLRLCAYLRMNLSSKEIAPLLNISVRGVEERRYRLRKRMQLTSDTNLSELIMTY
jgi:DNA-binding CsgD family transcriptional regulator